MAGMIRMSGKVHILVAMEREGEALGFPFDVVGIGATSLPPINPDDIIINVGYCGGDGFAPGTIVEPKAVIDATTGEWIDLPRHFPCQGSVCVTSPTFVTAPLVSPPAVYDMELAKLARIPCAGLYYLKIVSDNLNEEACEGFHSDAAWAQIRAFLSTSGLIVNHAGNTPAGG